MLEAGADVFLELIGRHAGLGDLFLEGLVIGELAFDFGEFGIDIGIADFLSGGCLGHQLVHDQILKELCVAAELLLRVEVCNFSARGLDCGVEELLELLLGDVLSIHCGNDLGKFDGFVVSRGRGGAIDGDCCINACLLELCNDSLLAGVGCGRGCFGLRLGFSRRGRLASGEGQQAGGQKRDDRGFGGLRTCHVLNMETSLRTDRRGLPVEFGGTVRLSRWWRLANRREVMQAGPRF